jgi:hypothetical protein
MAVLVWPTVAALAVAGCFSPEVRDCSVTCASGEDCARGQLCGSDHFCASPARLGHCAVPVPVDAIALADARRDSPPAMDAKRHDASIDAEEDVVLHIHIDGGGEVELVGGGTCGEAMDPSAQDCNLSATLGQVATLQAIPHPEHVFDRWESSACAGQGSTCTFVPTGDTKIAARFRKSDRNPWRASP